ncbi:hypothetical protein UVI_02009890 [Ustilaginoidea virens]|uniref:FHA domain-containing protein n=1 Tax=Ustilaginoidea virens TaxID=1159556 RepID=A0A1B5L4E5_USTVR|nr:hypothetical protein UVI_02009890 [Ustilaginoidea virens]
MAQFNWHNDGPHRRRDRGSDDKIDGAGHRSPRQVPDESRHQRRRSRDGGRRSASPSRHRRHHHRRDGDHELELELELGLGRRREDDGRTDRRPPPRDSGHSHRRRHGCEARASDQDRDRERPRQGRSPPRRGGPLPSQEASFAVTTGREAEEPKERPNFGNSGALAAASNLVTRADGTSLVLKYHEPPEARKPPSRDQWKLFVFKGSEVVDTVELSPRSCWLIGREMAVVDLPAEHPSISKQHAVIQFRYTEKRNEFGDKTGRVKPYLIDLESANGTTLNHDTVPGGRYLELRDKDMIQFGHSTREYVLMLAPRD